MFDILGQGEGPIPQGAAGLVPYPNETYASPVLDCTQVVSGLELIPAKPGYAPNFGGSFWVIERVVGTQTTGLNFQAGSDPAHLNFFVSTVGRPTNAEVNGAAPPSLGAGGVIAAATVAKIPNAPVFLDITLSASGTGGFVLLARLVVGVIWIPVGS
jgi:hypothetical protein